MKGRVVTGPLGIISLRCHTLVSQRNIQSVSDLYGFAINYLTNPATPTTGRWTERDGKTERERKQSPMIATGVSKRRESSAVSKTHSLFSFAVPHPPPLLANYVNYPFPLLNALTPLPPSCEQPRSLPSSYYVRVYKLPAPYT